MLDVSLESRRRLPVDHRLFQSKRNAITALLPYAIWEEKIGQPEMLETFLLAAGASRMSGFMWDDVEPFVRTLFCEASPRAIFPVSPYISWDWLKNWKDRGDSVQWWAVATSGVPYTDCVGQSVVNALLRIASESELLPHITGDV